MKTLYIECNMGAAGDMLMGALSELIPNRQAFLDQMNKLGLPHTTVSAETTEKCGVTGTHIQVLIGGHEEGHHHHHHHDEHSHHHHRQLGDIKSLIEQLDVSDRVKTDAQAVYQLIAQAESKVHGQDMDQIHFHEVGTIDAIVDVVGNCILMEEIDADNIIVSPIHVGSGTVKCAHGILPVPAPATALILQGLPIYGGEIKGELCTPTGAALLKHFARSFGPMQTMTLEKMGYGMGTKDFDEANCVRVMLGEVAGSKDQVVELAANLDDMTAEEIGFALELLMEEGALDVYAEPITMKKSRPGVKLVCMAKAEDKDRLARLIFKHTTTIGIRTSHCERMVLDRYVETVETSFGSVQMKVCQGYGVEKRKAEYGDLARIAREKNVSIFDLKKEL